MTDDVERVIVDALVRHGYAGTAGDMLGGDPAHGVARMLNREVIAPLLEGEQGNAAKLAAFEAFRDAHHIPYVDEDHQGGNCADIVVGLIAKNMRVEASRRDWAAEAMRLEMALERERENSRG